MKRNIRILIYPLMVMGVFLMLAGSCKKSDNNPDGGTSSGTVKDIDGNVYHTVTIGSQVWMVENLKTTKYRNGDAIPVVTVSVDDKVWCILTTGARCNYDNNTTISNKYGILYNWYAVNDSRNIAPTGWHVASDEEWITLLEFASVNLGTSGSVCKALAASTDWAASNVVGAVGNDLTKNNGSGFTALPGGNYWVGESNNHIMGEFGEISEKGCWWTSSPKQSFSNTSLYLSKDFNDDLNGGGYREQSGLSVRCVKD